MTSVYEIFTSSILIFCQIVLGLCILDLLCVKEAFLGYRCVNYASKYQFHALKTAVVDSRNLSRIISESHQINLTTQSYTQLNSNLFVKKKIVELLFLLV